MQVAPEPPTVEMLRDLVLVNSKSVIFKYSNGIRGRKCPKWSKMAKNSPEDVYRLRMTTLGEVCFLHFFSPIALNGTCVGLRWIRCQLSQ